MPESPETLLERLHAVDPNDEEAVAEAIASMRDLNDRIKAGSKMLDAQFASGDDTNFLRAVKTYAGLCDVKFAIERIVRDRDAESVARVRVALMRRILDESTGRTGAAVASSTKGDDAT